MNGLSIEKAKRYDKAIERAKGLIDFSSDSELKTLEYVFPELRESEDEKIRKEILDYIDKATGCKSWVAWLEKQEDKDSQVKLPTFTFDDILALQCCMETVKKVQEDKGLYEKLNDLHGRVYDAYHLEKQGEQKPDDKVEPKFKVGDYVVDNCGYVWRIEGIINQFYILEGIDGGESRPTIEWVNKTFHLWDITEDAKNGDVLASKDEKDILIFRRIEPSTSFSSYYNIKGRGNYGWCDSYFIPATKEQRDKLEKSMADAGYAFDFDKKKLKKIEQKPADEVEPKFHKGDWVIDKQGIVHQVANVVENATNHTYGYDIVGGGYFNDNTEGVRLWNISDAKDGDILHSTGFHNDYIFIFNGLDNWKFDEPNGDRAVATGYCCLSVSADNMEFGMQGPDCVEVNTVKPATKEQRDTLLKAMSDAGYTFDFDKKELKEIEDEEYNDEDYGIDGLWHAKNILEKTLGKVDGYQTDDGILDHKCAISAVNKLCKEDAKITNRWNPSDEHIHWLKWVINRMPDTEKANEAEVVLKDLLEQLEEL